MSASIYADGLLDEVLSRVIGPYRTEAADVSGFLVWAARSPINGEHIKVRIHGEERDRDPLKCALERHARRYFESMPAPAPPRAKNESVQPDPDEELHESPPDRTIVWTTFRRVPILMPGAPWIEDDCFAGLHFRCLAGGLDLVLAAIAAGTFAPSGRLGLLARALVSGLAALELAEPDQASCYLHYHRDWLLRFFLKDAHGQAEWLEESDARARRASATVSHLAALACERWGAGMPLVEGERVWTGPLADLGAYIRAFRGQAAYRIDPFASDITFPPVFKALHVLANQMGLHPLQEAHVYHLLIQAVEGGLLEQ